MKDLGKIVLAVLLFGATLFFPLVKIGVAFFLIGYFIYNYWKWKNWTFLIPVYGASFNTAAALANNGKMPVFNPLPGSLDVNHVAMGPHTHLKMWCDLFPIVVTGISSLLLFGP